MISLFNTFSFKLLCPPDFLHYPMHYILTQFHTRPVPNK